MIRVLLLAAGLGTSLAAQANVLLIVADDLGVDSVACYREGNDLPATPALDAMARGGILFRNAWAYPSCSPTRAAILTGRHPCRTMVGRWIRHEANGKPPVGTLRPDEHTLPELLDRASTGHTHACIGKWHLHDQSFAATAPVAIGGFGHFTGFLAGQLPDYFAWPRVAGGVAQTCTVYATTQQTNDALAWIHAQTKQWLCLLTYNAPHLPMQAPPSALRRRELSAASSKRETYLATIEALDTEIGRLFTALGPERLAKTHVLFVGDNGSIQNLAVPPFLGGRSKGTPYEGGINVPLLYRGPAAVEPGREVTALACAVDVFATVLDLLGAKVPGGVTIDGVSLVPLLADAKAGPVRAFAWSEEFTGDAWPAPNENGCAIVRDERHKLIHRYRGTDELFDLQRDPWEQSNLLKGELTEAQQQAHAALLAEVARLRTPPGR